MANFGDIRDKSDEEVLEISQADAGAFGILVDRYQRAFLRKVRPIIEPQSRILSAEDIVQETFVKIYLKAKNFQVQTGASFKSWAYKILLNTCFTAYQKAKKEKLVLMELDPEIAELIPDARLVDSEERLNTDYLLSLISRLPNTLYRIANLYFLKGRTQEEIAVLENTSVEAVRTQVHRAKRAIEKIKEDLA